VLKANPELFALQEMDADEAAAPAFSHRKQHAESSFSTLTLLQLFVDSA
jgi:hypothetical protein